MKTIFTKRLSDDGLACNVYTNIKALHESIMEDAANNTYKPIGWRAYSENYKSYKNIKYSYNNLVKEINKNRKENLFTVAYIDCENNTYIEINECVIKS